jgi:predicted acyltransferase
MYGGINKEGGRFVTLDVFRGMTMFLMILVNTQGSGAIPFTPFLHSEWNGCTLTDLVFPSFLFAVGNALAFVRQKWDGQPDWLVLYKIGKRTVLIFLIGYLLSWYCTMHWSSGYLVFADFHDTRIMAVLQRIGLCYGITAVMARYLKPGWMPGVALFLLLSYWMVLFIFGTPGLPYSETGNVVRQIDLFILGERHMYREHGLVFDPEGLLSTIPASVNVMAGYLTGIFLIKNGKTRASVRKMLMTGILLIGLGLLWSIYFPLNKKLWTSSYVLYTSGIDLLAIGILLYGIEIRQWRQMVPFFVVLGKNSLFIYVLSNLLLILLIWKITPDTLFVDWINTIFFQKMAPGALGSSLFAITFALFCWWVAWLMDKWKIYVRI